MMLDPLYMMILLVTLALSGAVSWMVKSRFNAGQKVGISSGLTGADVAKAILMDAGITDVKVLQHHGFLSDHYNPLNKTLNLSPEVYNGRNASAAGVAAHEVPAVAAFLYCAGSKPRLESRSVACDFGHRAHECWPCARLFSRRGGCGTVRYRNALYAGDRAGGIRCF